jgi:benzylsuccinate CoA-transferase BbsE subunit
MLGYPVSTVADIASDPQLDARAFFQSVAGSAERFCGSFAVIDGVRPPLRHSPGEMVAPSVGAGLKPAPTNAAKRAGTSS